MADYSYSQIGLGSNVTLEAITVPTEIILWRSTPQTMRTACLDIYAGSYSYRVSKLIA